ncbi:MAG: hypothetical protein Rsou_0019 [Candidatus Ruthia sp. Asou_11_S2]|nr:hypothetical protein [Candidatus Ruthia sp. Asou_11_S2]
MQYIHNKSALIITDSVKIEAFPISIEARFWIYDFLTIL